MNLSDDALATAAAKAILEGLTKENRDELIQNALKTLIEPQDRPGSYRNEKDPSKLQQAFDRACEQQLGALAREFMDNDPEFQAQAKQLLQTVVSDTLADEAFRERIAAAFISATDRYR